MSETTASRGLSVIFIGTPEFAVPSLQALAASSHRVTCVVTAADRPSGRGLKAVSSPVGAAADTLGIPVVKMAPRDSASLACVLSSIGPDVCVVVAWGGILNARSLAAPRVAALNLHASLLPRYRGAAPIERALMAGEKVTGVTVMYMVEALDAGDILLQHEVEIPEDADAGQMRRLLAAAGAGLLVLSVDLLAAGAAGRTPQDAGLVSWAPKLGPADERISWHAEASEVANRVRALSPSPGAHFVCRGQRVKVLSAAALRPGLLSASGQERAGHAGPGRPAGAVLGHEGDSLVVAAGNGTAVLIKRVQPAGGRVISGSAWANGRRLAAGAMLEERGS